MRILHDVPLKLYSTMRLGGLAKYAVEVRSKSEVRQAEAWAESKELSVIMIGGGSNIIWRDDGFHGLLIINKIPGFKKLSEDETTMTMWIGGGKPWDDTVAECVAMGLSGIESLSLIPGSTGAAPVQNIGAYGQEIASTLVSLEAYDRFEKAFVTLGASDCAFGYRTSRFKTTDSGRFLITSLTLRLSKNFLGVPTYKDIDTYFAAHPVKKPTAASVRRAVVAIRSKKLPDPAKVANCGSFFANPIVNATLFDHIATAYPAIKKAPPGWSQPPYWELPGNKVKLSAGWLIEQAGFKAVKDAKTGMSMWPTQNLVMVNDKARSTQDLLDFRQRIYDAVQAKFAVLLEQEPEILPS